jgi:small subunit ribosomal protein S2
VNRLKELEQIDFDDVASSGRTKKELLMMRREKEKLERTLGGVRDMSKTPSAVWIVDTNKEHLAVDEAQKLGIPVVAILDTNCDPDEITYPIPGNDDAIRSVALLTRVVADAVAAGLQAKHAKSEQGEKNVSAVDAEPLAEWEQELLKQSEVQQDGAPAEQAVGEQAAEKAEEAAAPAEAPEAPATEAEAPAAEAEKPAASAE